MALPWQLLSFLSLVPFQEGRMAAAVQYILSNQSNINCNNMIYAVVGRKIKL